MRLIDTLRRRLSDESGFTMILVISTMFLVTVMAFAAFQAIDSDASLTITDSGSKQALDAAQAGLQEYIYQLDNNNSFWTECVPSPAQGINLAGSTANRAAVPGSSTESYAIELMPANGASQCSTSNPSGTMITQTGSGAGAIRIRVTGYSTEDGNAKTGSVQRTIVAVLREDPFISNVWFTDYETDDPIQQVIDAGCTPSSCGGSPSSFSSVLANAQADCATYARNGRYNYSNYFWVDGSGYGHWCDEIDFISADDIQGPMETNDQFFICGSPTFGRNSSDEIQIAASSATGESAGSGCSNNVNNQGQVKYSAGTLPMPATNSALQSEAATYGTTYTGPTCIVLSGSNYSYAQPPTNSTCWSSGLTWKTAIYPADGVIYVQNSSTLGCSRTYQFDSPDYATSSSNAGCGIAYVSGTGYNTALTIGAASDIVITGNTTATSTAAGSSNMLGLIANGFIRVAHTCGGTPSVANSNISIDAAMLSVQHSFIVDNFDCGSPLGNLSVLGAIAQNFRGSVGTHSGNTLETGYSKNYVYDDRLKDEEPPHFLNPVDASWTAIRENECYAVSSANYSNSC